MRDSFHGLNRRELLRALGVAAAAPGTLPGLVESAAAAAALAPELVPYYVANVSGTGAVGTPDRTIIKRSLRGRRGFGVSPRDGYDHRADLLGRGRVDRTDLRSLTMSMDHYRDNPLEIRERPITVAWHYGWFLHAARKRKRHHVWFIDGGYSSRSPQTEALFNDLKNEFGITVDALSWADPKMDGNLNENIELGYMNAANGRTRCAAMLYESLISLRVTLGDRVDFERRLVRKWLAQHFVGMARTFVKLRDDSKARVFTIDGRPVIFIYGSHTWGLNVDGTGPQYDHIDAAMENAIAGFERVYGMAPFILGEETTFGTTDSFDGGRQRRAANFDGVFNYHHASSGEFIVAGAQHLRGPYLDQVKTVLSNTYSGIEGFQSRFTGKQLIVVPSMAAGFSRAGVPTLFGNRGDYGNFLKELIGLHEREHILPVYGNETGKLPPPIVSVGSWNEEFEGHAIFPAKFNKTLNPRTQSGFDYVMAIKQAFGWNHYAEKSLDARF